MTRRLLLLLTLTLAHGGGCHQHVQQDRHGRANETMIRSVFDQSVRNAIIAERTIYPYHFMANSPLLNDLGDRQVEVFASALRHGPAPLRLSRGDAPDALYDERVQSIHEALARHGVEPGRIDIVDELHDEPAVDSARVMDMLDRERNGVILLPSQPIGATTGGR